MNTDDRHYQGYSGPVVHGHDLNLRHPQYRVKDEPNSSYQFQFRAPQQQQSLLNINSSILPQASSALLRISPSTTTTSVSVSQLRPLPYRFGSETEDSAFIHPSPSHSQSHPDAGSWPDSSADLDIDMNHSNMMSFDYEDGDELTELPALHLGPPGQQEKIVRRRSSKGSSIHSSTLSSRHSLNYFHSILIFFRGYSRQHATNAANLNANASATAPANRAKTAS